MTFYLGLYFAGADNQRGRSDWKKHDFLSGTLFCRCRQAAWTQRPEKTMTFYPGLNLSGVDRRRGRRDQKNVTFYPGLYFAGANRRRGRRDRKKP
jgi:hypothetical protein